MLSLIDFALDIRHQVFQCGQQFVGGVLTCIGGRDWKVEAFQNGAVRFGVLDADDRRLRDVVVLGVVPIQFVVSGFKFLDRQLPGGFVVLGLYGVVGVHPNVGTEKNAILFHSEFLLAGVCECEYWSGQALPWSMPGNLWRALRKGRVR